MLQFGALNGYCPEKGFPFYQIVILTRPSMLRSSWENFHADAK